MLLRVKLKQQFMTKNKYFESFNAECVWCVTIYAKTAIYNKNTNMGETIASVPVCSQ